MEMGANTLDPVKRLKFFDLLFFCVWLPIYMLVLEHTKAHPRFIIQPPVKEANSPVTFEDTPFLSEFLLLSVNILSHFLLEEWQEHTSAQCSFIFPRFLLIIFFDSPRAYLLYLKLIPYWCTQYGV
ncbi:hypothetical protein MPH_04363 [Macrophomina phaseolina MS6]|uniref:Uncharacterized protein n=1 Tax=Macrophomina phaseolina (strain MS6) TaxID=1126212 RepID=K2S054_MACPH|nr:hypothetical protein MPH_04363 [Macrophomina phaseolina MS6]